ncbi:MAG: threonine synthase [Saezia sp.]
MEYISTRGEGTPKKFCDILLEGLASDGGLYMPARYPQVDGSTLSKWRTLSYAELAFEICSLYIDDIPADDLKKLIDKTYTKDIFGTDAIVPVTHLRDELYLAHLSNGPTYAFKDMALQLLGNLFEYELQWRHQELNILGATSGDTGSAAEYAMRGKKGVNVFMLSPHERMSSFQQAQMYSLQDKNIHNLAIRGVFDDCQDIVKAVSNDLAFKKKYHIGTVNSINWARLLAQVVYYFSCYFKVTETDNEQVSFAVPSGNFGNICAAHVARMMGLPIYRLVLATNENNVLQEFFDSGAYRVRLPSETFETSSPSMDISKASNFERFIFDFTGRDAARVKQFFGVDIPEKGGFAIDGAEFEILRDQYGFVAGRSSHEDRLHAIAQTYQEEGVLIDPHTADALKVACELDSDGIPTVVMETAQPCKFAVTIEEALGITPPIPEKVAGLLELPRRFDVLPVDVQAVKDYIVKHV